jgi:hypothetical protein
MQTRQSYSEWILRIISLQCRAADLAGGQPPEGTEGGRSRHISRAVPIQRHDDQAGLQTREGFGADVWGTCPTR